MILQLEILQFAGIKNRTVTFDDGLNVIVGENEAGKSTLVEALYSVFFMPVKIGNKKVGDKLFVESAFPYGTSDYAEVKVKFHHDGDLYLLHKLWHLKKPLIQMMRNNDKVINETEIESVLNSYLKHTEGTYNHLFFSKQDRFKQIFEVVKNHPELYQSIGDLLRNAGYELDGLSVEEFRNRLTTSLKELDSNWDLQHERPLGGRGIDNPHKRSIGKILEAHYESEQALADSIEIETIEMKLESLHKEIRESSLAKARLSKEIETYKALESDIRNRQRIEISIEKLEDQKNMFLEINKEWPETLVKKELYCEDLNGIDGQIETFTNQLQDQLDYEKYQVEMAEYEKRRALESTLKDIDQSRATLEQFSEKTVLELSQISDAINRSKLMIESAELGGRVLKALKEIVVVDYNGKQSTLSEGDVWTTDAYMKIIADNTLEIEIKSNQIDFDSVKETLVENEKHLKSRLNGLNVQSLEEARMNMNARNKLDSDRKVILKQLEMIPEVVNLERLMEAQKKYDLYNPVPKKFIEDHLKTLSDQKAKKNADLLKVELKLENWEKTFGSHETVAMQLGEVLAEIKSYRETLSTMQKIPEHFQSSEAFFQSLDRLRDEMSALQESLKTMEIENERLLGQLPDKSSEELKLYAKEKSDLRNRYIRKAMQIKNILETLEGVLNTSTPQKSGLETEFISHIKALTDTKYKDLDFDESLNLRIQQEKKALPVSLLSSGTLDSIALAFRLSVMEIVDPKGASLAVFDDCLINMDKKRMDLAIQVIGRHAQKRQILYMTCHEHLALALGGRLIKI